MRLVYQSLLGAERARTGDGLHNAGRRAVLRPGSVGVLSRVALVSTTLANRLEALTEVDNVAEQRALARAGFVQEGTMRGRAFVRGGWRDALVYSRLRSEPPPSVRR